MPVASVPVLVAADAIPPDAVIADVRWYLDGRSGAAAFAAGHLPGAVFVDLDRALSGPADAISGRHPLPSPEAFATALGALGIGDDDHVVAYDDLGGTIAARLVWLLRAIGRPASLLDGGLQAWTGGPTTAPGTTARPAPADVPSRTDRRAPEATAPIAPDHVPSRTHRRAPEATAAQAAAGMPSRADALSPSGTLESGPPRPRPPVRRTPVPWPPGRFADIDQVAAHAGTLLDARPPARFRGDVESVDPRPGHIPGAHNAPTADNLGADGRFKDPDTLRAQFRQARDPIVSCGSGVTACHTLLALELAGTPGRLYPGSWSQWAADPSRPAATGD